MFPLGSLLLRLGGLPAPETTGTGFGKTSPRGGPGASPSLGGVLIVQPELPESLWAAMYPGPGGDRDPPLQGRRDVRKTRQNRSTRLPDVCQEEQRFPEPLAADWLLDPSSRSLRAGADPAEGLVSVSSCLPAPWRPESGTLTPSFLLGSYVISVHSGRGYSATKTLL